MYLKMDLYRTTLSFTTVGSRVVLCSASVLKGGEKSLEIVVLPLLRVSETTV